MSSAATLDYFNLPLPCIALALQRHAEEGTVCLRQPEENASLYKISCLGCSFWIQFLIKINVNILGLLPSCSASPFQQLSLTS